MGIFDFGDVVEKWLTYIEALMTIAFYMIIVPWCEHLYETTHDKKLKKKAHVAFWGFT